MAYACHLQAHRIPATEVSPQRSMADGHSGANGTDSPVRKVSLPPRMKGTTKGPFPRAVPVVMVALSRQSEDTLWAIQPDGPLRRGRLQRLRLNSFWPGPNGRHDTAQTAPSVDSLVVKRTTQQSQPRSSSSLFPRQEMAEAAVGGHPSEHSCFFLTAHTGSFQPQQDTSKFCRQLRLTVLLRRNILFPWKRTIVCGQFAPGH